MALDIGELVARISADATGFSDGVDKVSSKGAAFVKTAAKWGAGAAVGIGGAVKGLYEVGSVFDDVGDSIRVKTGATGKDLDALTKSAERVGTSVPASFEEASNAVADLHQRLGLTGPTLEKLSKQILEAGGMTGEAIDTKTLTGAFSVFGVTGKQTTGVMDELWRISQNTGVGLNELASSAQRNGGILTQFGFDIGESAALIGTLDKAGLDGNKTIATLGKAMVTFAKDGKEPKQALRDTIGEMQSLLAQGKDADAINLAGKVFGTRGAGNFVAALKSGKVNIDDLMGAAAKGGDSILKAASDTADFSEKWQVFKNKGLLLIKPLAMKVFGALSDGMELVNKKAVPAIKTFVHQMKTGQGPGGEFARILKTIGHIATDVVVPSIVKLAKWIARNRDVLVPLVAIFGTAIGLIKVISMVTRTWAAVQALLNIALMANPLGLVVLAIAAVVSIIVILWKRSETFRGIVLGLWDVMKGLGSWLKSVFVGAVDGVTGAFHAVTDSAGRVKDWLSEHWPLILAIITGPIGLAVLFITKKWDTIKGGAQSVVDWIKAIPGKIRGLGGDFVDAGKHLIGAFFEGLGKAAGFVSDLALDIWQAIKGLINGAIGSINDGLPDSIGYGKLSIDLPDNPIPMLATGGRATAATLAVIGEGREPESVLPDSVLGGLLKRAHASGAASAQGGLPSRLELVLESGERFAAFIRAHAGAVIHEESSYDAAMGRASYA